VSISEHDHRAEGYTGPREHLPALDGLRFVAAMLVASGHYISYFGDGTLSAALVTLTGLGMTLFFVLSGFVIHYNYSNTIPRPGGVWRFFVARFARLYPLYIVLFLLDFTVTWIAAHGYGACGRAGVPGGQWFGLVYYLTLTQSWFYAVICQASLIYQYGLVSAVSWSISVESLFYIVYAATAILIARRKWSLRAVIGLGAAAYVLTVIYLLLCVHYQPGIDRVGLAAFGPVASSGYGYQDSLLRWLLYFNPAGRLGEFFVGMAAAHIYLAQPPRQLRSSSAWAPAVTLVAILATVAIHLWLYMVIAPGSSFIGRIASPLYGPVVAIALYLIARHDTPWSRILSHSILVRLGQASYSIYLLHGILPLVFSRLGFFAADPRLAWPMWAGSLVLLVVVSRISYVQFERPARLTIRRLLAPELPQQTRYL
jgi:peptidoglycan/LPS O-acetylase OafA/YrhL